MMSIPGVGEVTWMIVLHRQPQETVSRLRVNRQNSVTGLLQGQQT
jgi:hypothetical protein